MATPRSDLQTLPSLSDPGKYVIGERIAMGGMAEVFKGFLRGTDDFRRPVVIKKILPRFAQDSRFVRMFVDEARLAARLSHANIVQVLDFGRTATEHFIVMEYVDGPNLGELCAKSADRGQRRLPIELVLYIMGEVLKALSHAHRQTDGAGRSLECVHRDVSPSNVLLSRDGQVKLSDFGVAKAANRANLTMPGQVKGKLNYLSPEQALGEHVDGRADLFAAGIVLHELLTGRRLFRGESPVALLEAVQSATIRPPSQVIPGVPAALDPVVLTALQRDRAQRFPDADAFLHAMVRAAQPAYTPARARDLEAFLDELYPPVAVEPEESASPTMPMNEPVVALLARTAGVATGNETIELTPTPRKPVQHPPVAQADTRPRRVMRPTEAADAAARDDPAWAGAPGSMTVPDLPPLKASRGGRRRIVLAACVAGLAVAVGGAWLLGLF